MPSHRSLRHLPILMLLLTLMVLSGFAAHRMDHDAAVLHEAALLHDFAELLLWVRAPALALEIACISQFLIPNQQ